MCLRRGGLLHYRFLLARAQGTASRQASDTQDGRVVIHRFALELDQAARHPEHVFDMSATLSAPKWSTGPPRSVCALPADRPIAATGCCAQPVTCGLGCWTAIGCAYSGVGEDDPFRRAVDGRGQVGAAPLQRRLAPGRQTAQPPTTCRIPTSQAQPGSGPLLPRHIPDTWTTGAAAGRQGRSGAVGAAGPAHPVLGRAGAGSHVGGQWGTTLAGRDRSCPRPSPPGPRACGRGGPRHHPSLRTGHRTGGSTGIRSGAPGRELPAPTRPAGPPREGGAACPKPGQRGSRRWRRHRLSVRRAEARHRRRVHQTHHEAAKQAIAFAVRQQVGTLLVGDPKHITSHHVGRVQNLRLRQWRRTHLAQALRDKAERAGIMVRMVDERGTSSTCPACRQRVPKPRSRRFSCPHCQFQGHRDLVGAYNIAAKHGGGPTSTGLPVLVEHRRAGIVPARRDRRRHLHDRRRRSCLASGLSSEHACSPECRSRDARFHLGSSEDQATSPSWATVP
jgi:IS605 OrfB family transposase